MVTSEPTGISCATGSTYATPTSPSGSRSCCTPTRPASSPGAGTATRTRAGPVDCVIRLDRNRRCRSSSARRRRPRPHRPNATSSPSRCRERDSFVPTTASTTARAARPQRARASMRRHAGRGQRGGVTGPCAARLERRDGQSICRGFGRRDHGADRRRRQPVAASPCSGRQAAARSRC